ILILRHVGNQRAKSLEEITIAERHFGAVVYQENLDVALIGEIYFRNAAGESRRPVVEFLEHSHSGYDPSGVFRLVRPVYLNIPSRQTFEDRHIELAVLGFVPVERNAVLVSQHELTLNLEQHRGSAFADVDDQARRKDAPNLGSFDPGFLFQPGA